MGEGDSIASSSGSPERRPAPSVARLLWSRLMWRHWRREPKLTAVIVGILALGVAVFLSVRLANRAAVSGFGLFTESVTGESDYLLRPRAGQLGVAILPRLREAAGADPVGLFPVLEVSGAPAADPDGELLRLVGADLVALQSAASSFGEKQGDRSATGNDRSGGGLVAGGATGEGTVGELGRSDRAFVGRAFAEKQGVEEGDAFGVIVNDVTAELTIAGILPEDPNRPSAPANLLLMDLPGLQELARGPDRLSRVEVRVPPGPLAGGIRERAREAFHTVAQERDLILETPESREESVTRMSAAFRLNLTILSGLALLVGAYLIMQAMEAAVVKRRAEIATLRSLGVTPEQIRAAWLLEGLALGVVGSVVGIVLGRLLAAGLVGGIARTVNTLYYQTTTTAVRLEWGEALFSLAFGVFASVLAGWAPARDASSTPPAQALRQGSQGGGLRLLRRWNVGLVLTAAGFGCAFLPAFELPSGAAAPAGSYVAAVLLVIGVSILIGPLFRLISGAIGGKRAGPLRRYAGSQLRRPEGRHRLTAAGLVAAVGMSAAMGILVASFESTLTAWIRQLLKADVYVSAAGANSVANENTISQDTWTRLGAMPGVAGMDRLRRYRITLGDGEAFLGGADYNDDPERRLRLIWLEEPDRTGPDALAPRGQDPPPAWVSESFARRFDKRSGDRLLLPTPEGERSVLVTGVYADYGNETGAVLVDRELTRRWFDDEAVSQLAIYARPDADVEKLLDRIRSEFPALTARTNARLREESLRIFHQTFAVTYALEAIAVFIAVAGLGLALAGLLLERRTELATLKSIGVTRREIATAAMWEGGGLAAVGLVGGFALSFVLGWILIYRINPQSFGWTLSYHVPWAAFVALAALVLATAAATAFWVGYRNADLRSDREE